MRVRYSGLGTGEQSRKLWVHRGRMGICSPEANKNMILTAGAISKRNWISKDVLRRALDVRG
jgi:hypothetical protein